MVSYIIGLAAVWNVQTFSMECSLILLVTIYDHP